MTVSASKILGVVSASAVLALAGCHRDPEPAGRKDQGPAATPAGSAEPPPAAFLLPKPSPASPAAAAAPAANEKPLVWTDPPGWTRAPSTSAMRLATYRVPKAAGDASDAEVTVFHFGPGQGGGVDANFDRWVSQFRDVDRSKAVRSEHTGGGFSQHILEIERGTFATAMGMGSPADAKENYGMLAAIVDTPGGPYFFKLTGPAATVKSAKTAFMALLDSLKL
jgi:hypothetical protein